MGTNTGEIQPITRDVWVQPDPGKKEVQVISPVAKAEGATTKKTADDRTEGNASWNLEKNAKMVEQLQAALDEALNVQLNFKVDTQTNQMVVQVVDRENGKVIRQIPQAGLQNLREKVEELRGIIFDTTA